MYLVQYDTSIDAPSPPAFVALCLYLEQAKYIARGCDRSYGDARDGFITPVAVLCNDNDDTGYIMHEMEDHIVDKDLVDQDSVIAKIINEGRITPEEAKALGFDPLKGT